MGETGGESVGVCCAGLGRHLAACSSRGDSGEGNGLRDPIETLEVKEDVEEGPRAI